jgi:molybdenum cofactor guanylyltransferase
MRCESAPTLPPWTLIILAGGRGLRAGGIDKGWRDWQGTSMIAHLLARFGQLGAPIIVSANRHLDAYRELDVTVVTDLRPDFPGPLAGIEAALAISNTPCQVILPCDMPLLPADLPLRLMQARQQDRDISIAHDGVRQQHLCMALNGAHWQTDISRYLDSGGRSLHGWLQNKPVRVLDSAVDAACFANLNSADEAHPDKKKPR